MAGGVVDHHGGIAGLVQLLADEAEAEAVEYDLITMGLRLAWLGTPALSWRDMLVIVRNLPRTSALVRVRVGEAARWGDLEHLVATAIDALAAGNWQRAGKPHAPRPKPVKRPGKDNSQRIGKEPLPLSELDEWIAAAEAA